MSLMIVHRGYALTQEQVDVIVKADIFNRGFRNQKHLEAEIDRVLEAAGCPVPAGIGPEAVRS